MLSVEEKKHLIRIADSLEIIAKHFEPDLETPARFCNNCLYRCTNGSKRHCEFKETEPEECTCNQWVKR